MRRLRMAVVGVGHLGKEHARILAGMPDIELVGVADSNFDQAQAVARRLGTQAYANFRPLLDRVEAATIVVPTVHHSAVAREFLARGIPVLIEKPITADLGQAETLVDLADKKGVVLQVGHIERFNPAFEELAARPFQAKFVECERLTPFSGRSTDIGAVLDLMIHDLDLLSALVKSPVRRVEALGVSLLGRHEDVANARLEFANGCIAQVTANRISLSAARRMRLWAPEGFASIDFAKRQLTLIQPSAHLRQQGLEVTRLDPVSLQAVKDEMFGRHFHVLCLDRNAGDQLTRELDNFVHSVRTGSRPRVSGVDGLAALALATRVLESLAQHSWDGQHAGPTGPSQLPAPLRPLFQPSEEEAAA